MRKTIFIVAMFSALVYGSVACSNDDEISRQSTSTSNFNHPFVKNYLETLEFKSFQKANKLEGVIVDVSNIKTEKFSTKAVTVYLVPLLLDNYFVGNLCISHKETTNELHSLFEDYRQIQDGEGKILVSSIEGEYISTLEVVKRQDKYILNITQTAPLPSVETRGARRRNEAYAPCVTRVYQTAKRACENDPNCNMLCDGINILLVNACHAEMMVAAAAACL